MCQSASAAPRSAHCTPLRRMATFVSLSPSATRARFGYEPCSSPPPSPSRLRHSVKPLPYTHVPSHRPDLRPSARASFPRHGLFSDQTESTGISRPLTTSAGASVLVSSVPYSHAARRVGKAFHLRSLKQDTPGIPALSLSRPTKDAGTFTNAEGPRVCHGTHHIPTAMRQGIGACLLHTNRKQLPQA